MTPWRGVRRPALNCPNPVLRVQSFIAASPDGHRLVGFPPRQSSTIGVMTTSRFLVGINADRRIPEQATFTRAGWRRPARPRSRQFVAERTPALIDGLIDRVHLDWPETSFILALPSGEQVFVPRHSAGPRCTTDHSGYCGRFVLPYCAADQTRGRGRCRMTPFAVDEPPTSTPFYEVDLPSGMLVMGACPARHQEGVR